MIETVEKTFAWASVPFKYRYSQSARASRILLKDMWKIDPLLDLKFYMPTEKWHVVRYPHGRGGDFVRVWECKEDPDRGLHEGLGHWIIDALKAADTRSRSMEDRLREIDEHNAMIQKSAEREVEAQSKDAAKDLSKVFENWHDYGPDSETHLVHPSAEIQSAS